MEITEKILTNKRLTENEISRIIRNDYSDLVFVKETTDDEDKWEQEIHYIFKINTSIGERFFAVDYTLDIQYEQKIYCSQIAYELNEYDI